MKVLQLSSEKTWRGGEQQIAYLIEELQKLGIENHVACRRNTPFERYCQEKKIPYISLPFANEFDFYTAWQIKKYCRKHQIDLIHAHSSHSHAQAVWADLAGNNVPIILSRRVDFPVKNNLLSKFKYRYKNIKQVVCVSDKIREIVSVSVRDPKICTTVHSGIDLSRFEGKTNTWKLHKELNLSPETKLIGNVSAIAPHKDYFTFTDTVEILAPQLPDAKFLIVGDGPMREQIEAYVKKKNLQDTIIFTGFRKDIPEILPELDVMLITSETEGLGTTILDAFACQVPVVATKGGGIPEIVKHRQTGLLAEVKDPAGLAENVLEVLSDLALKKRLIDGATYLLQNFTKEATARKTLEVYKSVLHSN